MRLSDVIGKLKSATSAMDRTIISFLMDHSNLITALFILVICVLSLLTGRAWIALGILLIGAVSYFVGITVGLVAGLVCTLLGAEAGVATDIVSLAGYCAVAWLGYRHKEEKEQEEARQVQNKHPDQVVPWAVANEIRTSLAAIRFLLFPIHDSHEHAAIDEATKELSRLENLFSEIEKREGKQ